MNTWDNGTNTWWLPTRFYLSGSNILYQTRLPIYVVETFSSSTNFHLQNQLCHVGFSLCWPRICPRRCLATRAVQERACFCSLRWRLSHTTPRNTMTETFPHRRSLFIARQSSEKLPLITVDFLFISPANGHYTMHVALSARKLWFPCWWFDHLFLSDQKFCLLWIVDRRWAMTKSLLLPYWCLAAWISGSRRVTPMRSPLSPKPGTVWSAKGTCNGSSCFCPSGMLPFRFISCCKSLR